MACSPLVDGVTNADAAVKLHHSVEVAKICFLILQSMRRLDDEMRVA